MASPALPKEAQPRGVSIPSQKDIFPVHQIETDPRKAPATLQNTAALPQEPPASPVCGEALTDKEKFEVGFYCQRNLLNGLS